MSEPYLYRRLKFEENGLGDADLARGAAEICDLRLVDTDQFSGSGASNLK